MASESCGFIGETFCLQEEGVGWLWSPEWPPQNSARSTVIWHHGEWWPCLKYRGKERILKYTKVHSYIRFTPLFAFALPVWFDLFPFSFLFSCALFFHTCRYHLALWPLCPESWYTPTRSQCCWVITGSPSALPSKLKKLLITGWNVSIFLKLCFFTSHWILTAWH